MEAIAISKTEIVSNYKSPANQSQSTKLAFKFSINGKDNEMLPGVDHHFNVQPGITETPVIKFGESLKDSSGETNSFLQPDTKLKIRVDMNALLMILKRKDFIQPLMAIKFIRKTLKDCM
jgi:hypothetical protein